MFNKKTIRDIQCQGQKGSGPGGFQCAVERWRGG